MYKKYLNLILLVVTLAILSSISVLGAVTFNAPTASSTISGGAVVLNVTGVNLMNCTFFSISSSTANSSWTGIGTFFNLTANAGTVNGTFDSRGFEDSNNYQVNATCRNQSNLYETVVVSSVTFDNSVPTTPTSLVPASASVDTDGSVTFSVAVSGNQTIGCDLFFQNRNPGAVNYTMTHTGDTCTSSALTIPEETYTYYVRASDGTNTTDSAITTFRVYVKTSAGKAVILTQQEAVQGKPSSVVEVVAKPIGGLPIYVWVLLIVAVIIIIGIIRSGR